jgi:hypothetical protein
VEPIRNLFAALFLSSIGMLINVHFLWNHVDILLASVILVIVIKTAIAAVVVKAFRYNMRISFHVSLVSLLKLLWVSTYYTIKTNHVNFLSQMLYIGRGTACSDWRVRLCSSKPSVKPTRNRGENVSTPFGHNCSKSRNDSVAIQVNTECNEPRCPASMVPFWEQFSEREFAGESIIDRST